MKSNVSLSRLIFIRQDQEQENVDFAWTKDFRASNIQLTTQPQIWILVLLFLPPYEGEFQDYHYHNLSTHVKFINTLFTWAVVRRLHPNEQSL